MEKGEIRLVKYNQMVFEKLYEWNLDDEMRKITGGLSLPMDRKELQDFYSYEYDGRRGAILGVEAVGKVVGVFFVSNVNMRHLRCDAHFAFDKGVKKAMYIGLTKFLDLVFNEYNLKSIHGITPENNTKALAFVHKIGFKKRCIIPDYFNMQGEWIRGVYHSLTKSQRRI